jgi:hypothetical protein
LNTGARMPATAGFPIPIAGARDASRPRKMPRKFQIGQTVTYQPPHSRRDAPPTGRYPMSSRGHYQITGFLPAREGQVPEYRIRNLDEGQELVARESQLRST